jgi:hypothetical protein
VTSKRNVILDKSISDEIGKDFKPMIEDESSIIQENTFGHELNSKSFEIKF